MAEAETASHSKKTENDRKRDTTTQRESPQLLEQFPENDLDIPLLTENPYYPRMDEHASLLSSLSSGQSDQAVRIMTHLQQTYGNRYVQRLVESVRVQSKLTVNNSKDAYEQEADRVAESVNTNMDTPVQRQEDEEIALELQRQEMPEEDLQAKMVESRDTTVSKSLEARSNDSRGYESSSPDHSGEPMEQASGPDFRNVHAQTGSEAGMLNQQPGAKAFTTGKNIFLKEDGDDPNSDKLIAREITHVTQPGEAGKHLQLNPDPGQRRTTLRIPWADFDSFRERVIARVRTSTDLQVPHRWVDQLFLSTNLSAVYDELESQNPRRRDGTQVRIVVEFTEMTELMHSSLRFEPPPTVIELGEEMEVESGPSVEEQEEEEERTPETELEGPEAIIEALRAAVGAPQAALFMELWSNLDLVGNVWGAVASTADLLGVAAMGTLSTYLSFAGCLAAVPLGLYNIGRANQVPFELAYGTGYVLALADMSEGNNPNSRPWSRTLGPDITWESNGRADAILYMNRLGQVEGTAILAGLRSNFSEPQARVNALWARIILGMSEGARRQAINPTF